MGKWEQHKPRVWRLYTTHYRATIAPWYTTGRWVWTIVRTNGNGHTEEIASGWSRRLRAMQIVLALMLRAYEQSHHASR